MDDTKELLSDLSEILTEDETSELIVLGDRFSKLTSAVPLDRIWKKVHDLFQEKTGLDVEEKLLKLKYEELKRLEANESTKTQGEYSLRNEHDFVSRKRQNSWSDLGESKKYAFNECSSWETISPSSIVPPSNCLLNVTPEFSLASSSTENSSEGSKSTAHFQGHQPSSNLASNFHHHQLNFGHTPNSNPTFLNFPPPSRTVLPPSNNLLNIDPGNAQLYAGAPSQSKIPPSTQQKFKNRSIPTIKPVPTLINIGEPILSNKVKRKNRISANVQIKFGDYNSSLVKDQSGKDDSSECAIRNLRFDTKKTEEVKVEFSIIKEKQIDLSDEKLKLLDDIVSEKKELAIKNHVDKSSLWSSIHNLFKEKCDVDIDERTLRIQYEKFCMRAKRESYKEIIVDEMPEKNTEPEDRADSGEEVKEREETFQKANKDKAANKVHPSHGLANIRYLYTVRGKCIHCQGDQRLTEMSICSTCETLKKKHSRGCGNKQKYKQFRYVRCIQCYNETSEHIYCQKSNPNIKSYQFCKSWQSNNSILSCSSGQDCPFRHGVLDKRFPNLGLPDCDVGLEYGIPCKEGVLRGEGEMGSSKGEVTINKKDDNSNESINSPDHDKTKPGLVSIEDGNYSVKKDCTACGGKQRLCIKIVCDECFYLKKEHTEACPVDKENFDKVRIVQCEKCLQIMGEYKYIKLCNPGIKSYQKCKLWNSSTQYCKNHQQCPFRHSMEDIRFPKICLPDCDMGLEYGVPYDYEKVTKESEMLSSEIEKATWGIVNRFYLQKVKRCCTLCQSEQVLTKNIICKTCQNLEKKHSNSCGTKKSQFLKLRYVLCKQCKVTIPEDEYCQQSNPHIKSYQICDSWKYLMKCGIDDCNNGEDCPNRHGMGDKRFPKLQLPDCDEGLEYGFPYTHAVTSIQ